MPLKLGYPFELSVQIRTFRAKSLDMSAPLEVTSVVNPNHISLERTVDLVDSESLETLRKTWVASLSDIPEVSLINEQGDIAMAAFIKLSKELNRAALSHEATDIPIPDDYTISLMPKTPETALQRQRIISGLVPFKKTKEMLLRFEETLDLPIATVRMASARVNGDVTMQASLH